ncbi:hypothetical protein Zmor_008330 [Zophobas morio]|uniref:Uncharacterized protein n=1 Tax=Zophobas morio TaxID=2755281 RepID=A0AA38IUM6_9CUCU|nr:hypothetical protein Zmor_008330 [Zophobas morio]
MIFNFEKDLSVEVSERCTYCKKSETCCDNFTETSAGESSVVCKDVNSKILKIRANRRLQVSFHATPGEWGRKYVVKGASASIVGFSVVNLQAKNSPKVVTKRQQKRFVLKTKIYNFLDKNALLGLQFFVVTSKCQKLKTSRLEQAEYW